MQLYRFEPGDGWSYRVLFGRVPGPNVWVREFVLFGWGLGDDSLVVYPFANPFADSDNFAQHLPLDGRRRLHREAARDAAYRVYQALVAAAMPVPPGWLLTSPDPAAWRSDWRAQLLR